MAPSLTCHASATVTLIPHNTRRGEERRGGKANVIFRVVPSRGVFVPIEPYPSTQRHAVVVAAHLRSATAKKEKEKEKEERDNASKSLPPPFLCNARRRHK